jgi:hypothetical protein
MLPKRVNQHSGARFGDLEEQALALYSDNQALSPRDTFNAYEVVNNSSSNPPPIGQGPSEPSGVTNVHTPLSNIPSTFPRFVEHKKQASRIPKAIHHSKRPFAASKDTDDQPTATNQVPGGRPPAIRYNRPIVAKSSSNSTLSPSRTKNRSAITVQAGHHDNFSPGSDSDGNPNQRNGPGFPGCASPVHYASVSQGSLPSTYTSQHTSMGPPIQSVFAVERPPFSPRPHHNIKQYEPQAPRNLLFHPPEPLRPTLNCRRSQNSSPTTIQSKLPQGSPLHADSTRQSAPTSKRQKVDASSPASVNSSSVTSPSAFSPYSQSSSFTSMDSNTPSQVWSASSSPLPSHHGTISAQEYSSPVDIDRMGIEMVDPPPLSPPGSAMQAVDESLSEHLESFPEASTSGGHSTPSRDALPRRPLTYTDDPTLSTNVEAPVTNQDAAGITQETIHPTAFEPNPTLVENGESDSDNESSESDTETTDEDQDLLLDDIGDGGEAGNYDEDEYAIDLSTLT